MVITIDGPAGSGKSTIARQAAQELGAVFLDTGAMYRAVTFAAIEAGLDLQDESGVVAMMEARDFRFTAGDSHMHVAVDGQDISREIREPDVTTKVKYIAASGLVRAVLVRWQQEFAGQYDRVVTEGRDQGTVVFPDAAKKFFLTAGLKERARRRMKELQDKGKEVCLDELIEAIHQRDESDRNRKVGPLRKADDAIEVDTTNMTIEEVVQALVSHCREDFGQ